MNIEILRKIPFNELEYMIRKVPLVKKDENGSEIFPYKDAYINLRKFRFEEVNPPTFYLLRDNLNTQRNLAKTLTEKYEIDPLRFDNEIAAVELKNLDTNEIWLLTPPIIENVSRQISYVRQEGEIDYSDKPITINVPLICDGAHRVAISKEFGGYFNGINIVGASPKHPYYAHPNGWDMVNIVNEVPKTKEDKKLYSREDCYALYRNFDVLGCGKPRGTGGA